MSDEVNRVIADAPWADVFPDPIPVPTVPCRKCRTPVMVTRLVAGAYGEDCAGQLGLMIVRHRVRVAPQTGPNLLDLLEEGDHCDGWDR